MEYGNLHNFGVLQKLVDNRDIEFIRQHKDELECWSYLSTWLYFTVDELREFKDCMDWNYFFLQHGLGKQYKKEQIEEFKLFVSDNVAKIIEKETHEHFR